MIKLKLPGIGVVNYHKDKPPNTIYFEDLSGNKNYDSFVGSEKNQCDWVYERVENEKLFKLREV